MPLSIPAYILNLLFSIKTLLVQNQTENDAEERERIKIITLIDPFPPLTGKFFKNDHAIVSLIETALRQHHSPKLEQIQNIGLLSSFLPWRYHYPHRDDAPNLKERIAFAELIGPEAPFYSESICLGFTFIAPETLYPEHYHPATELYYILSGTASWNLDGITRKQSPGSYILHPSNAVHAMQTHHDPLLALYTWSGSDIRTPSVYTPFSRSNDNEKSSHHS
jgi:mannose-6-phosphate isomerase-like protein (cupin superfamily)